MKHLISDDGNRLDIEVPDYFIESFYRLFLHKIIGESESDICEKLRVEIMETEWLLYDVLYSYELAKDLNGIGGGPTLETLFNDDKRMKLILDMYEWWCSIDMYPEEFPLWWHNFLIQCWFNCFSFKD